MAGRRGATAEHRQWASQHLKARNGKPFERPDREAVHGYVPQKRSSTSIEKCLQPDLYGPLSAGRGGGEQGAAAQRARAGGGAAEEHRCEGRRPATNLKHLTSSRRH